MSIVEERVINGKTYELVRRERTGESDCGMCCMYSHGECQIAEKTEACEDSNGSNIGLYLREKKKKDTPKDFLKTGMRVLLKNDWKFTVMLDTPHGDLLVSHDGFMKLSDYSDDLLLKASTHGSDWDVIKVMTPSMIGDVGRKYPEVDTVWTRKPRKTILVFNGDGTTKSVKIHQNTFEEFLESLD